MSVINIVGSDMETSCEERARGIVSILNDRARRRPFEVLDAVAVADLVHYIATGEVRGWTDDEDMERLKTAASQVHRGALVIDCPRLKRIP